jgi:DNA primase
MIPEQVINDIRDRSDIVQVVAGVIDLKRSGRNFKALCPFHPEKTPSFMVSPDKQIYHCFGCGKGGNVFSFLMEYEGVGFVEAVRKLGKDLGIEVDRYLGKGEQREKLEPHYRALEFAIDFYSRMLESGEGSARAREYLIKREIDEEMIESFRIGFAPPGWDNLYKASLEEGVPLETLLELNLVMKSRGGSGYRDYFRNRIMFPIASISNRTVGLAGRVLDGSEPKYLNTAESRIYSKGKILYGLNHSRDYIRKDKTAILLEGYMDYLMLWKKEIRNICAVCGTSLTEDQARLLARYANRVYIINDGDRAGIRAAVRASDQLLIQGLEARIVILPEGEDPDSFVRKMGADALHELMRSAPHYFDYLKGEAEKGSGSAERKNQVVQHLLASVSRVGDNVKQDLYMQEISSLFRVPVETLRTNLRRPTAPGMEERRSRPKEDRRRKYEKSLFRLGLEREEYARRIVGNLSEEDFDDPTFRRMFRALEGAVNVKADFERLDLAGAGEDTELGALFSEIALMDPPPGPAEEFIDDTVLWLKRMSLRDELDLMKRRLNELQSREGAGPEEVEIAEAYRKISRELKKMGTKEDDRIDGSRKD